MKLFVTFVAFVRALPLGSSPPVVLSEAGEDVSVKADPTRESNLNGFKWKMNEPKVKDQDSRAGVFVYPKRDVQFTGNNWSQQTATDRVWPYSWQPAWLVGNSYSLDWLNFDPETIKPVSQYPADSVELAAAEQFKQQGPLSAINHVENVYG